MLDSGSQVQAVEGDQIVNVVRYRVPQNQSDQTEFQNRLNQLNQSLGAKHTGQARHRIEFAEFGYQHAHGKDQTTTEHSGNNRHKGQQNHDGQNQDIAINHRLEKNTGQQFGLVHHLAVKLQLGCKQSR